MGACDFWVQMAGKTVKDAFWAAVEDAQYMNGNGGYTGSIAEKHEFEVFKAPAGMRPEDWACLIIEEGTSEAYANRLARAQRVANDKWGPAVAVPRGENQWIFIGWASS